MMATYQPKREPKSPAALTGPFAPPPGVERAMFGAPSPYCARLSCLVGVCFVGVLCLGGASLTFSCLVLAATGMAFSSSTGLALGAGGAGAGLGFSVASTLSVGG